MNMQASYTFQLSNAYLDYKSCSRLDVVLNNNGGLKESFKGLDFVHHLTMNDCTRAEIGQRVNLI